MVDQIVDEKSLLERSHDSQSLHNLIVQTLPILDIPDSVKKVLSDLNAFNRKLFFKNSVILRADKLAELFIEWNSLIAFLDEGTQTNETSRTSLRMILDLLRSMDSNLLEYLADRGLEYPANFDSRATVDRVSFQLEEFCKLMGVDLKESEA